MDRTRRFLTILSLACALAAFGAVEPKAVQTLELQPGWNLVALEGVPLRMQEFLELRPMVYEEDSHSYVLCTENTEMMRGMALWIFSDVARTIKIPLVSASTTLPPVQPAVFDWTLAGAVDNTPLWLEQVARPFFLWDTDKGFMPAETPEAQTGYWVKAK